MIKLENVVTPSPEQWKAIIMGTRNPKNSWDRSDTIIYEHELEDWPHERVMTFNGLGDNDHDLMMRLVEGGPVHAKYRRMIVVYVDITAPLYWWKEFDTYKVGTVANSCSTMHKIHAKEFTMEDFSTDQLYRNAPKDPCGFIDVLGNGYSKEMMVPIRIVEMTIEMLNQMRNGYLSTTEDLKKAKDPEDISSLKAYQKKYWWQMIQLLPSSYNQKRTVMLNYEVLAGIYPMRKNHKLDEWREFCQWIEGLPYSEIIVGKKE